MRTKNSYSKLFVLFLPSCIFSCLIVFNNNFHFTGNVFDGMAYNYVSSISLMQLFLVIPVAFFITFILLIIATLYKRFGMLLLNPYSKLSVSVKVKMYVGLVIVLCVCWLPYLLSNMPGAVYSDGFNSIQQVLDGTYSNHHPLLYTAIVGAFINLGLILGDLDYGITFYTLFQMIVMAGVLAWSIIWMLNKHVKRIYLIITFLLFAFFPLFPYYAIAFWKDTFFSLFLLLFCILQIDIYLSDSCILHTRKGNMRYLILALGVIFFRNNGIYIVLFSWIILIIIYRKSVKKYLKKFILSTSIALLIAVFIQGPVFEKLDLSTEFVENLGIPMQQISAVVACGGDLSVEETEFLQKIWDLDELAEMYTPCLADTPKGYVTSFDSEFLENHKKEFIEIWIQIFFKNPQIYVKAFLMENLGFWHLTASGNVAYVQSGVWPNDLEVVAEDYFYDWFGFSFTDIVYPKHYISCGLLFWICMLSMVISIYNNGFKALLMFAPIIGAWITMMVATPVAISLRYMYILILILPYIVLWPAMNRKNISQCTES